MEWLKSWSMGLMCEVVLVERKIFVSTMQRRMDERADEYEMKEKME